MEGKEISRLHARVKGQQGVVEVECLTETSLVRLVSNYFKICSSRLLKFSKFTHF